MLKTLSLYLSLFLIITTICSCKKEEQPIEKKLEGTWELNKITFVDTNKSFPLDSFRNVFNVNLTLNSDFSFNETENIGHFISPLGSVPVETYTPRNAKARYLFYAYTPKTWPTSRSFSIKQGSFVFNLKAQTQNSTQEEQYIRKFTLKNNQELEIERLDLIVFNIQNNSALSHPVRFSYKRK